MIVKGDIPRFNTIGKKETDFAASAMEHVLSGYLGGIPEGGMHVQILEERWCEAFGCTHAIAVNSATSGLLAACHAVDVRNKDVLVSPYTMSATAAAPLFMGADNIDFCDIEPEHYCMNLVLVAQSFAGPNPPKVIIVTNLFGHPAKLKTLAKLAHANGAYLIEDNAQAPFAMEDGSYAGTIGDIGVFSLNVHKHIQSGEGGVVVTDNDDFAHAIRLFINHGEMAGGPCGLNLRMTEVTAAIACAQLSRGKELVQSRRDLAHRLIDGLSKNEMIKIHPPRQGCEHVYYALAMEIAPGVDRGVMVEMLKKRGVPLQTGYVNPLYHLPAFSEFAPKLGCWVAEQMHNRDLMLFETCAWDPSPEQIKQIIDAFDRVADDKE